MAIETDADTIYFRDYDAFFMPSNSPTTIDVLEHYGLIDCLERVEDKSYSRYGSDVTFDLSSYGIDLIERDGVCYVPMQTFADVYTSPSSYVLFLYNGECVCVDEYGSEEFEASLLDTYYASQATSEPHSDALANFTYQELCMALDYSYGLSRQHNIDGFDDFLIETGKLSTQMPQQRWQYLSQLEFHFDHFIGTMNVTLRATDMFGRDIVIRKTITHDTVVYDLKEWMRVDLRLMSYVLTFTGRARFRMTHFLARVYTMSNKVSQVWGFDDSISHRSAGSVHPTFKCYNDVRDAIFT
jgi:hypothetical protein